MADRASSPVSKGLCALLVLKFWCLNYSCAVLSHHDCAVSQPALTCSLLVIRILLYESMLITAQVSSLLVPMNPTSLMLQLDYSDVIR